MLQPPVNPPEIKDIGVIAKIMKASPISINASDLPTLDKSLGEHFKQEINLRIPSRMQYKPPIALRRSIIFILLLVSVVDDISTSMHVK